MGGKVNIGESISLMTLIRFLFINVITENMSFNNVLEMKLIYLAEQSEIESD